MPFITSERRKQPTVFKCRNFSLFGVWIKWYLGTQDMETTVSLYPFQRLAVAVLLAHQPANGHMHCFCPLSANQINRDMKECAGAIRKRGGDFW